MPYVWRAHWSDPHTTPKLGGILVVCTGLALLALSLTITGPLWLVGHPAFALRFVLSTLGVGVALILLGCWIGTTTPRASPPHP